MHDEKEQKRFETRLKRAVTTLKKILYDAQKVWPEANFYLEEDTLHLMSGVSHDHNGKPVHERSVTQEHIPGADGGGW